LKAEFVERPQVKRKYEFCDQLREAARSAPTNIAEGFGRFGNKQFANFARIAKASETNARSSAAGQTAEA